MNPMVGRNKMMIARITLFITAILITVFEANAQMEPAQPVTILPIEVNFLDSVIVTLSTETDGARIIYSLIRPDSNHTENIPYTGPFVIKETVAVDAWARKEGLSKSGTRTRYYKKISTGLMNINPIQKIGKYDFKFTYPKYSVLGKAVPSSEFFSLQQFGRDSR